MHRDDVADDLMTGNSRETGAETLVLHDEVAEDRLVHRMGF